MSKRDIVLAFIALILLLAAIWRACRVGNDPGPPQPLRCTYGFPSYNPDFPPPAGTPADGVFSLSQNYPAMAAAVTGPWQSISFQTDPRGYAASVLAYCLEGNREVDFKVQDNAVRKWYHAPWLHFGGNGREWRHGLTKERFSRVGELHPNQTSTADNAAVGFYNEPGGYTIGQTWPDCGRTIPQPRAALFPEGTVTFKLLFTTATAAQVPFLADAITWRANIARGTSTTRTDNDMRLLQIDIAVKDARSPIGWVFGTFIYDGLDPASDPWARFKLVGLAWGSDPGVTSRMNDFFAFVNPDIRESWINPEIIGDAAAPVPEARAYHLGAGGRLNGPVDNKISSCTSCHGKAAVLKDDKPDPIEWLGRNPRVVPRTFSDGNIMPASFNDFFGFNVPPGTGDITYNCFVSGLQQPCTGPTPEHVFISTDYSLQLAMGIENYYASLNQAAEAYLQQQATPRNDGGQ